jgi:hypothetical protein
MIHSSGYVAVVPVHLGNTDRLKKKYKTFTTRTSGHPTAFGTAEIRCNKYSVCPYPAETWSLTFMEEFRLCVFENMVLRMMFGPKRDGVTGEWRKQRNGELIDLYSSPNVIRVIK